LLQVYGRTVCILLLLLACGASPSRAYEQELKKLAGDLATRMHAANHARVTVVDFVDLDKKPSKLGNFLAQLFQLTLAAAEYRLDVVDQSQLPQLFDQMELFDEGLLDPATGRELGKIAGTEVLVLGTVMPSSMTIRLDIKAIDLQTAKVIAGGTAKLARLGVLDRLTNEAVTEGSAAVGSAAQAGAQGAQAKAPPPPPRVLSVKGVVFELDKCALSGDGLTCVVTATSEGRGRWFSLAFRTRAWNQAGEEYEPGDLAIANTAAKHQSGRFYGERGCVTKEILESVATSLSVTFPQFDDEADMVERLRLVWSESDDCYTDDWRVVEFDKIALGDDPSAVAGGGRSSGGKEAAGSRSGGLLKRLGSKVLDGVEKVAEEFIEEKTHGLIGDDDDEEEKEKEEKKPPD
jgi:hypothetical protein